MSKFNSSTKNKNEVNNHEGGKAYKNSPELELYSLVATSLLSDKFYESEGSQIKRIKSLIKKCSPEFVAKLAKYARNELYLRSVPVMLTVELAKIHNGDDLIRRTTNAVVQRTDEITEILSYWKGQSKDGKLTILPKQLKKGLQDSFHKFDEYQFGKYSGKNKDISMQDAIRWVHPKAIDEKKNELFRKIAKMEVKTPYTWEVELSKAGKEGKDKSKVWEELIDSGKLPYMALIRNLRNILNAGVSRNHILKVESMIQDEKSVLKSKMFPFRFYSAWKEVPDTIEGRLFKDALSVALKHSAKNILIDEAESHLMVCDVSGSMTSSLSNNSSINYMEVGLVLSSLLFSRSKFVNVGAFGTDYMDIKNLNRNDPILTTNEKILRESRSLGWATNGHLIIKDMIEKKRMYDNVFVFTDCEIYTRYYSSEGMNKLWKVYKETINPNAKLYLFNLAGYGTTPVKIKDDCFMFAGWSEKVFNLINEIKKDGREVVKYINSIEL